MSPTSDEYYRRRIRELEAENARLASENAGQRDLNEMLKAQRREHLDILCPSDQIPIPSEDELMEIMRNHVPGSGMRFLEELGILPSKPS